MTSQALPDPIRLPRTGLRQLWANGWGARLVLIGTLLSFPSLFAAWDIIVSTNGHSEYSYRHRPDSELQHEGWVSRKFVPGEKVDGGDAFDRDAVTAWFLAAFMVISVVVVARPLRPDQGAVRWVPIAFTALLILNGVSTAVQLVNESETFLVGSPAEIHVAQGIGPFWLVLCQILSALGGILFLRRKAVSVP